MYLNKPSSTVLINLATNGPLEVYSSPKGYRTFTNVWKRRKAMTRRAHDLMLLTKAWQLTCLIVFILALIELVVCCLFDWGLSSHSRIFHSYGDVTNTGERLQILTYSRHSWSLSSEDSKACHTYCGTGHLFKMVISEDPWHSHLLPSV